MIMKNIKNLLLNNTFSIFILFLLLIIPLFDLFHPGLPVTHDGQDHVARIANFYQNLQEGNVIPRWAASLNWGYGHPILMFLYPLPSYSASLFHFLGFSFVDSVKIVFGLSFILSGLTMFLWLRSLFPSTVAVIGSLLYTFVPYRFVDLYVRGAIGEHVAFIFPPLVLYFLYKLSKKYSYWYLVGGAFSVGGLILAHNAISLMFLPIIVLYVIYLAWKIGWQKKFILYASLIIVLGFGLAAFFWAPAFFEGKYTLRDIVTGPEALSRFLPFSDFIYGPWSYGGTGQFTAQIGILHWVLILFSIPLGIHLFKKKNKEWIIIFVLLIIFAFTLYLMTASSKPIWQTITTLQKFQFPWRFLSLTVFLSAVIGSFVVNFLLNLKILKSSNRKIYVAVLFIFIVLFLNKNYWHAKDYLYKNENFYSGIYLSTTDTGESSPIWSVRFMENLPKAHIEVLEGEANIKENYRSSTNHSYSILATSKAKFRENTLYFPGWKVFVDGKESPIEFQDYNNRGLMTFWVEKGEHGVGIRFEETKLRIFANLISIMSLLAVFSLGILSKKIWRR